MKYGKIWQIDKQTNEKLRSFNSTEIAANWLIENDGLNRNIRIAMLSITNCLNGTNITGGGYKWEVDLTDLPNEIWREISFLENVFASSEGRIKYGNKISYGANGKMNANGLHYKQIKVYQKMYKVHRLVAFAFLPNFYGCDQVNHKDGNPQNNRLYNLEWTTNKENIIHAYETGLNPNQKKVNQYTRDGEFIKEYRSVKLAGETTSIDRRSISRCCNREQAHAGGFLWRYE